MKSLEELVKEFNVATDVIEAECPPGGLAYSYPIAVALMSFFVETKDAITERAHEIKALRNDVEFQKTLAKELGETVSVLQAELNDQRDAIKALESEQMIDVVRERIEALESDVKHPLAPLAETGLSMDDIITNMERMARIFKGQS